MDKLFHFETTNKRNKPSISQRTDKMNETLKGTLKQRPDLPLFVKLIEPGRRQQASHGPLRNSQNEPTPPPPATGQVPRCMYTLHMYSSQNCSTCHGKDSPPP